MHQNPDLRAAYDGRGHSRNFLFFLFTLMLYFVLLLVVLFFAS